MFLESMLVFLDMLEIKFVAICLPEPTVGRTGV